MNIKELDIERYKEIKERFSLSSLCAKVLASKQMSDEEIEEHLQEKVLINPMLASGMKEVVDRIYLAKVNKEKVLVCGDYDADGICATSILVDALNKYGVDCGFYIPNRFKEGYGLQLHTVTMAHEKGYTLLITVDNGVKAFDALKEAEKLGLDVIVSDHHSMDEEFPCLYLLHPEHMGDDFSFLSGAGVALEISRALLGEIKEHVVLACVASIGDVMQLRKETRTIVKLGISYLKQGVCLPVQMLANDRYPQWDEMMIAFQIVPKLNATGRLADMANANNTVRYLMSSNRDDIMNMSKQIHNLNDQRKVMSDEMVDVARSLVHDEYRFQLLFHDSFHEGMAGIVAGKLQEELHQPVMVVAQSESTFKGSIRSGNLLDLTTFFNDCMKELSAYGGHPAAAGIGFSYEKKQVIQDYVNNKMKDIEFHEEKIYEVIPVSIDELSIQEVESLSRLAPFGNGFEEPLFYLEDVPVISMKALSQGAHAKWVINDTCEAMYFRCQDALTRLADHKQISFLGNLRVNTFMKRKKVNIFVLEAR